MSEPTPAADPKAGRRLAGGILLAIGILIASLSGLCTMAGIVVLNGMSPHDILGNVGVPLMFGGPFLLIGAGLIWFGQRLLRRPSLKG